ncbi:MAG: hypothetical protein NTY46_16895 [Candidatus Sumerlaeota bacterium]|nr:hypothetical protein [Candidatus Sumerlaeota bacterium]
MRLRPPACRHCARDLVVSLYKMSTPPRDQGGGEDAGKWLSLCHSVLREMRDKGMRMDKSLVRLLEKLDSTAQS